MAFDVSKIIKCAYIFTENEERHIRPQQRYTELVWDNLPAQLYNIMSLVDCS